MKNMLILVSICFSTIAFSQSNKEDIDLIQSMYGKEKKSIVESFVSLNGAQKMLFGLCIMNKKRSVKNWADVA